MDQKLGKIILKEIQRLNRLITEFLDYAKPDQEPLESVSLKSLLEEVMTAFLAQSNNSCELQALLVEGEIAANVDKLKQAFLNILMNALQAMEGSTRKQMRVEMKRTSDALQVSFHDSGVGIEAKIMDRIFEPFFTTKSKGTGLGLALTHKIIQSHRGSVEVFSTPGLGTEFKLTFPLKI
jgi:two-component system sensor histidine kinase PilS (NtrC family)